MDGVDNGGGRVEGNNCGSGLVEFDKLILPYLWKREALRY